MYISIAVYMHAASFKLNLPRTKVPQISLYLWKCHHVLKQLDCPESTAAFMCRLAGNHTQQCWARSWAVFLLSTICACMIKVILGQIPPRTCTPGHIPTCFWISSFVYGLPLNCLAVNYNYTIIYAPLRTTTQGTCIKKIRLHIMYYDRYY